jgi:molybdopterin-guanine dinucleotide biosynthesis protein A
MQPVSGVVVAGGRSRRLGEDKRGLRLWGDQGPTLLEHTLEVLAPLCTELIVVLNDPQVWQHLHARLVTDVYEDAGSLGGIYAGLAAVTNPYAVVVAADMPLLNKALLQAMLERPRDYDALVPRSPQLGATRNALDVEPLHAVYSREVLGPLRETLDTGKRRIVDFLARVRVVVIEPDELIRHDPHGDSFLNVNTPDELMAVRNIIAAGPDDAAARKLLSEPYTRKRGG